jgi:hypothetical protein
MAVLIGALSLAAPFAVRAQTDPAMLGRAIDAVVQLSIVVDGVVDGEEQLVWYAVGSGTVVSPNGLILTNEHLIAPAGVEEKLAELRAQLAAEGRVATLEVDAERFMVATSDGRHLPTPRYSASVAETDPELDLAVLRIDADERGEPLAVASLDLATLPLGSSDAVNLGEPVHVFGFPAIGSGSLTYTTGIVSGFLFEEGIDGTAWINTDAVTSGGNSGGAAVNDRGELIGVPTSGSALDCRAGDTNRDGRIGPDDVGCLPTGGSLTQLRPIDLARPLLAAAGVTHEARPGVDPGVDLPVETSELSADLAAAEGCAARGDWRCAANFYLDALAAAPGDAAIATSLYDAYLALGTQEAAAGRLDSARAAFAAASGTDPSRTEAVAALSRLAPYRRAMFIDTFDSEENFVATEEGDGPLPPAGGGRWEGDSTSAYDDGAFRLRVARPGLVSGFPLQDALLAGEDVAVVLRISETGGDGMVTIETRTDRGEWIFAVDPTRQTWEVLRREEVGGQFVTWTGPHPYGTAAATLDLDSVELRIIDGFPLLLVDGIDVAASADAPLPEIGNDGELSFGALMSSDGIAPFIVTYDEIAVYELGGN